MDSERRLDSWITAYSEFTEGSEPPGIFHLWVGLGTLAGAAQRKVTLRKAHFHVYSNVYIVLVGDPGSKKSSAMRIGKGRLKDAKAWGQEFNFSTQATSVAALVKQFVSIKNKTHQSLTAFNSELGSLLGANPAEILDFLNDIYDCEPDWDKQTVGRGLEMIEKPWFTLLAGTTPNWLGDNLSKNALEGGFASRTIFVYGEATERVAFPQLDEKKIQLATDLAHDLAYIAELKGEMHYDREGAEFYRHWYEEMAPNEPMVDQRLKGYYSRKGLHVEKVAMLLSLSESDSLVITRKEVETALNLLKMIEPGMAKAFASVGGNPFSTDIDRIRAQVLRSGGMSYKELIAANIAMTPREKIDEILTALVDMEIIQRNGDRRFVPWKGKV